MEIDRFIDSHLRDIGWVGIGVVTALGLDYLFYLGTGRFLGPANFGYFGVILSIYYISIRVPFSIIEITSRKIEKDGNNVFAQLTDKLVLLSIIVAGLFLAFSPFISNIFEIPLEAVLTLSLAFPVAYLVPAAVGSLQGAKRFREFALYEIFSASLKFSALILVLIGLGLVGATFSLVLELYAAFFLLYFLLRPSFDSEKLEYYGIIVKSSVFTFATFSAFNIDIIMMKLFMSVKTVGLYTAISVFGKALFFGSSAVSKASFPSFSSSSGNLKLLARSAAIILSGGVFSIIFFQFFGKFLVKLTFGLEYIDAVSFAPAYMGFMTLLGLCLLLGNYHLSLDTRFINLLAVLPLLQTALILAFHEKVIHIVYSSMIASATTFFVLLIPVFLMERSAD